jgi:hypothetical protein
MKLGSNFVGGVLEPWYKMICSNQNLKYTIVGLLEGENGSDVDKCEDFVVLSFHESISEVDDCDYELDKSDDEEQYTRDNVSSGGVI